MMDNPKYKFDDGLYYTRLTKKPEKVMVENDDDSISIYRVKKGIKRLNINQSTHFEKDPLRNENSTTRSGRYWKNSFDIDFLTVPAKLRPATQGFPTQLSTSLNGMIYLGYRRDYYRLEYKQHRRGKMKQEIGHTGVSLGAVTGLGATLMSPYVTQNQITIEYEGLVWSKGLALLFGLDRLNFGLVVSVDNLLDKNRGLWIYQSKICYGLGIGLNIN